MMRYFKIILITLLLGLVGCDFLEYDETTNYKEDDVFNSLERSRELLTNIYSRFRPGGFNAIDGAMRASGSDNAAEVDELSDVHTFNDGSWSANNIIDSKWVGVSNGYYYGIRGANKFIENFDTDNFSDIQYNDDYDQLMERAEIYPYEARFLRAFFYFELMKRYGDVPLITSVITPEEANTVSPSSFEEVADFIISEMNAIAPHLPVDYNDLPAQWTGRATRGAAMALKNRVLLYEASPLHNESDDQQKWIDAAESAKALIDSADYTLEPNYSDIFNNITSEELIWERRHTNSNDFERANFPIGFESAESRGTTPTQNLVDSYEMQSTGLGINESGSGYDPSSPYNDRDPRLLETVIVNNSTWKGRQIEIWDGGEDGPPTEGATETGYYLKKYVIEDLNIAPPNTTTGTHTWIVFRYGEILLNYAEAMNEAFGPEVDPNNYGMTARQAVNQIRQRANMPDFPAGLGQEQFREKLRNERRVELAFENHRFWDVRRWEIGESTTDIYGMNIERNEDGSFTYEKEQINERVWNERMNLYPIPQEERFKNNNLPQNPGW